MSLDKERDFIITSKHTFIEGKWLHTNQHHGDEVRTFAIRYTIALMSSIVVFSGHLAITTPIALRWYSVVMENDQNRVESS